jgi:hypothetical protein
VQSKKLKVNKVTSVGGMKLHFNNSKLVLAVQPLTSSFSVATSNEAPSPISDGNTVLWLGYYVVYVEPAPIMKSAYIVQTYYRVLSQKREYKSRGNQLPAKKPPVFLLI